jgi:hypothetical protein
MKYLIGFCAIALLFTNGCKKSGTLKREHAIVCMDLTHKDITGNFLSSGNVFAFVVKGHSVLSFIDEATGENKIIFLSKNDCEIY